MTIPDYQTLMTPVLRALLDGGEHSVRDVTARLAEDLGLSEEEVSRLLPSGADKVWRNRVRWAIQYLYQAGAVQRTRRGVITITDRGRDLLTQNPGGVKNDQLSQFEEFRAFRERGRTTRRTERGPEPIVPLDTETDPDSALTPYDRIASAASEANNAVAAELLARINEQPPEFLERVVLDLLVAMGYAGAMGAADHLGRSGDEGVDGVIRQDALGLDQIFVQAKRYASGRTVGRPDMQAFVGALHGAQASRGVFITTSRFSADAVEFAHRVQQRLVLIDGRELSRLMVTHGVGVQTDQSIELKKVDEDFFDQ